MERYHRQTVLPEIGEEGQRRLLASSVLIVGLGGLGCPAALYLAGAGIGRIGLCDPDSVSLDNLHRQTLYSEEMVGMAKTEAARSRLTGLSSSTVFDIWKDGLTASNARDIIPRYDIVVDCCDNHATRYLIDDVCSMLGKTWIYGSIGAFDGLVGTFRPGAPRYSDVFPDRKELSAMPPASGGVIGMTPGAIGAIEASEALKTLAGFGSTLSGKLLSINLKTLNFNIIDL